MKIMSNEEDMLTVYGFRLSVRNDNNNYVLVQ